MKIVQCVPITFKSPQVADENWSGSSQRVLLDISKYSGVEHIYFEVHGEKGEGSGVMRVELYDYTNNQTLAQVDIYLEEADDEQQISDDIKDLITGIQNLGVRAKVQETESSLMAIVKFGNLVILQNDSTNAKKTVSYFCAISSLESSEGQSWYYYNQLVTKPQIDKWDGDVKVYLEALLRTQAGGEAQARIYDETISEPVVGSVITTTETGYTRVISGELTLVANHEYRVEIRNSTAGKIVWSSSVFIKIEATNFTKIVAQIGAAEEIYFGSGEGYLDSHPYTKVRKTAISAGDGLLFMFDRLLNWVNSGVFSFNERLYDKTAAAALSGTTHAHAGTGPWTYNQSDTPSFAEADNNIECQSDNDNLYEITAYRIYAIMEETYKAGSVFQPNPKAYSGYHCFVEQYVKNKVNGYLPLKLPDGTLW